jgi:hypothetical protein
MCLIMYVCMHSCIHACMYVCMHICIYAHMHVCMYVHRVINGNQEDRADEHDHIVLAVTGSTRQLSRIDRGVWRRLLLLLVFCASCQKFSDVSET